MVRRRRAEVQVSTLSTEQKRELVEANDKGLNKFVKCSVVEAASSQGISPAALMKMRWVVTFKDDGSLKARLVVQGFKEKRLGKIPMTSPNASRRSRQMFLTLAASLGFSSGRLGRATTTMMTISKLSQHNPFCERVSELSRKLQLEHHQCIRLLKSVYVSMLQEDGTTVLPPIFET